MKDIESTLKAWREAESSFRMSPWGSPEYRAAALSVERLRSEYSAYMDLQSAGRRQSRAVQPGRNSAKP